MNEPKKRFTVEVSETTNCWKIVEVEAHDHEEARRLAEDLFDADWADHATSEVETTILAVDGKPADPELNAHE